MFLSLLIPTWHFNFPDSKTFLSLGNIIKSRREEKKNQLILNISNFKKNTLYPALISPHQDFLKSTPSPWPYLAEEDMPCNWWAFQFRMKTPDRSLGFNTAPFLSIGQYMMITFWGNALIYKKWPNYTMSGRPDSFPVGYSFWLPT